MEEQEQDIYRRLLEHVNEGVFVAVESSALVFVNDAACGLTGYPRSRLLGMPLYELLATENVTAVKERFEARVSGAYSPSHYEIVLRRADGQMIRADVVASRTSWLGQPASVAIIRDVTGRRQTEEALKRSEELLRTVLENAPGFVFSYDIDEKGERHSAYIGVGLRDLIGPESAAAVGKSIQTFIERIHPEDFEQLDQKGIFDTSYIEPIDVEYRVLGDNDSYRWVHNTMRAVSMPGGRVRWYGVMRDITGRKRTADELARLRRIESIGLMAGGIAHEVHNALYPARVNLQVLVDRLESEGDLARDKMLQLIERADRSVERAVRTTDAIRQFARAVSRTEMQDITLLPLLRETATDIIERDEHPVEMVFDLPDTLTIHANPDHAYSVFANVFSNAADAMLQVPERKITVSATQSDMVTRIVIVDTGEGIADSMKERVFEPFVSSKPRTGTGVGLAICQRILEIYGGSIAIEAAPESGARVTIELPR